MKCKICREESEYIEALNGYCEECYPYEWFTDMNDLFNVTIKN